MTNNNIDIDGILQVIKSANQAFKYSVHIPSLKKNVSFSELTTFQQKKLIKSILDSDVYNAEFILCLYEILRDNCGDSSVDVSKLTVIDKLLVLLQMRSISIGRDIEVELLSRIDPTVNISTKINLDKVFKNAAKQVKHITEQEYSIENYTIVCGLPTIEDEYRLEVELRELNETYNVQDMDSLRTIIGEKFIGELTKYVKSITVPTEDGDVQIELNKLSFAERVTIIEQIPSRCLEKVFDFKSIADKQVENITLYRGTFTHKNKEKETFEYNISLDGDFFIKS